MNKYSVILSDPPWHFNNYDYAQTKKGTVAKRGVVKEYNTMSIEDIYALPVPEIADDNCVLFLWSVWPLLDECVALFPKWGFTYKTLGFLWVKTYQKSGKLFWGMGNWSRSNTEPCLLGVRGDPKRVSAAVHQVFESPETIVSPVGKHSTKPLVVRQRVVELCGDVPRLEMFSRDKTDGWNVFGNEVDSDIELYIDDNGEQHFRETSSYTPIAHSAKTSSVQQGNMFL